MDYQHEIGSAGYLVYGRGYYTFLNLTTSTLVGAAGGNAYASFLLGAPYVEILRDEFPPGPGRADLRIASASSRRTTSRSRSKLTVNLGARYDIIMPYPREMHNRLSNFDPATGTMRLDRRSKIRATAL